MGILEFPFNFTLANLTHIPAEQVGKVRRGHPEVEIRWYENAGHGFNCGMRASYNPEAFPLARSRALEFLKKHLA
jgi:carboxymethylenebutenolidase